MSPIKFGRPEFEGVQEYASPGSEKYLGVKGAIEISEKGKEDEIPVDVDSLISQKDGFQAVYSLGTHRGRTIFRAGNLPMKDRPRLRLPDGREAVPVREDEMPHMTDLKPW
jgi:hypothetical protein